MVIKNQWTEEIIPTGSGRIAVITGANSGVGFEASRILAKKDWKVILACRDLVKGENAVRAIKEIYPQSELTLMRLNLANLDDIHQFASEYLSRFSQLDILINNAGLMATPHMKTDDGFELQFGTNHLGHFALTSLLLEVLLTTDHSRIVTVSSVAHMLGLFNFFDLNSQQFYQRWLAYGKSKLANLLFSYELQRRLDQAGSNTSSIAAHPGYASTNLQRHTFFNFLNPLFAQSAEMGAYPLLYAATSTGAQGGDFIGPDQFFGQRGYPCKAKSSGASRDKKMAVRLWEASERLTGIYYNFG